MACRYPNYGNKCQMWCNCEQWDCSFVTGCEDGSPTISPNTTISPACRSRYTGSDCELPCRYPGYGVSCQLQCECEKDLCHHVNGCESTCIPNIADVDHEEVVAEQMVNWRHGRRVVELGVLADALKACLNCGMPLQLTHAVDIQTYGLSAIIKIPCSNTCCQYLNNVPTGKKHGRVWDANTKLAAAMVHSGLGERQVNSFLSSLNIPAVSHKTISPRQTEMGTIVQSVASESTEMALMEERINREEHKKGWLSC
ncbi:uncharacterized protein LOC130052467 [Ostrea edulis]|uniref:uncharacterized protein LOC125677610 n=1 Tax=Ostrea edulis TaxID=37623 RepID=UPI0024AFB906|nr:uncharacterized protein LOC125677610 [Ostrea edulis]XP_056013522.1 uncharacterized protein LOC130052467 [Ostrea edulis]